MQVYRESEERRVAVQVEIKRNSTAQVEMKQEVQEIRRDWTRSDAPSGLVAIVPVYVKGRGDVTCCLFMPRKGERGMRTFYDMRPIQAVLSDLTVAYGCSKRILSSAFGEEVGRIRNMPIPLGHRLMLVPFKARQPEVKNDAVSGYFVFDQLAEVQQDEEEPSVYWVQLKTGCRLRTYQKMKSLRDTVNTAAHLSQLLRRKQAEYIPWNLLPPFLPQGAGRSNTFSLAESSQLYATNPDMGYRSNFPLDEIEAYLVSKD